MLIVKKLTSFLFLRIICFEENITELLKIFILMKKTDFILVILKIYQEKPKKYNLNIEEKDKEDIFRKHLQIKSNPKYYIYKIVYNINGSRPGLL